jgi:hypothetical protein
MPVMQMAPSATPTPFQDRERCASAEMLKTDIKCVLKTTPPMQLRRHRVSFNQNVLCRETLHKNDYTVEEKHNAWFQKAEMVQIKADMVATVRMITRGDLVDDTVEHSTRGLEFRSREGANKRKINKFRALEAVLDEQDEQFDCGIVNDRAISLVYQSVSLRCRKEAHARGICDAVTVHGRPLAPVSEGDNLSDRVRSSRSRLHDILKRNGGKGKDTPSSTNP